MNMKRGIMSTKRYDEVLDMLETDKKAIEKLSSSERQEIVRNGEAMNIAAATNIKNLKYLSTQLRKDRTFMCNLIQNINPLAMCYCYKSWFLKKEFVEFVKDVTNAEAEKYTSPKLKKCYDHIINQLINKARNYCNEKTL